MTIKSDKSLLKERKIEIKGYLDKELKARHLQWIVEHIDDPVAEELFKIIIQERNERAKINSSQGLEISRKDSKIGQLDQKNENLQTENLNLQQEVSHWKKKVNELLQQLDELRKDLLDFDKSEIYQLGRWLKDSLSKTGKERQDALLEQDLVHNEDHKDTVTEIYKVSTDLENEASFTVKHLQEVIDERRKRLANIQDYIINNYGYKEWKNIKKYCFNTDDDLDKEGK
jgi:FtsZ-binding cell division protein ZapB